MGDPHRAACRLLLGVEGRQADARALALAGHRAQRDEGRALPGGDEVDHGGQTRRPGHRQPGVMAHIHPAAQVHHLVPQAVPLVEKQEVEFFEVGDAQIAAAGHRVAFWDDHHELLLVEGNRGQPGILKREAQHRDVDAPLPKGIHQVVGLLLHDLGASPACGSSRERKKSGSRKGRSSGSCPRPGAAQPAFHRIGVINEGVHALERGMGRAASAPSGSR